MSALALLIAVLALVMVGTQALLRYAARVADDTRNEAEFWSQYDD